MCFYRIFRLVIIVLSLTTLQGCVTKNTLPELPATLGDKGLLVARVYILGMESIENASVFVDGNALGVMRDGYIAIPLAAGEHTLSHIRAQGRYLSSNFVDDSSPFHHVRGGYYYYSPGRTTYTTTYYTTLQIDRSFRVAPGKITNLGLIFYIPVSDEITNKDSRKYNVVTVDNSAEMNSFLETNYPELYGTLADRKISLAFGTYLDKQRLPYLRRVIALYSSHSQRVLGQHETFVYGRAGTVAIVNGLVRDGSISTMDTKIVDTGTLADIVGAAVYNNQVVFLTSDAKLLTLKGSNVTQTVLPFRLHAVGFGSLGGRGLVVVDNHMRIVIMQRPGDRWVSYDGAMIKEVRDDVDVQWDNSDGTYISLGNRGIPNAIYYLKSGDSVPKLLPSLDQRLEVSKAEWNIIIGRVAGLFVYVGKTNFAFWSKAGQRWEIYSNPPGKCGPISFADVKGENLSVKCDDITYRSNNSGASWAAGRET